MLAGWIGQPKPFAEMPWDARGAGDLLKGTRVTCFISLVDRVFRGRLGLAAPVAESRQG